MLTGLEPLELKHLREETGLQLEGKGEFSVHDWLETLLPNMIISVCSRSHETFKGDVGSSLRSLVIEVQKTIKV